MKRTGDKNVENNQPGIITIGIQLRGTTVNNVVMKHTRINEITPCKHLKDSKLYKNIYLEGKQENCLEKLFPLTRIFISRSFRSS